MKGVAELLAEVRSYAVRYRRVELSVPIGVPAEPLSAFHYVAEGRARLDGLELEGQLLRAGDLAVVPRAREHRLVPEPIGARSAVVLTGAASFGPVEPRVLPLVPDVVVVPLGEGWLGPLLVDADPDDLPPHTARMVSRIADVFVGHAVRVWLLAHPAALSGYAGALEDAHLGRALELMHRHPTRPWTVAALAAEARLSRSEFAQRFTAAVGRPPMAYLTGVRMRLATDLIIHEGLSAGQAATRSGYRSAVAFSRAYKRITGRTPEMTRRMARIPMPA